jgi:hypothetical protein
VDTVRFGRIDTPLLRSQPGPDSDDATAAAAGSTTPLDRFGTAEEAEPSPTDLFGLPSGGDVG